MADIIDMSDHFKKQWEVNQFNRDIVEAKAAMRQLNPWGDDHNPEEAKRRLESIQRITTYAKEHCNWDKDDDA